MRLPWPWEGEAGGTQLLLLLLAAWGALAPSEPEEWTEDWHVFPPPNRGGGLQARCPFSDWLAEVPTEFCVPPLS